MRYPYFRHAPKVCLYAALAAIVVGGDAARSQTFEVVRVEPDPAKGFNWAYFLAIPSQPVRPTIVLVEPNNSGSTSDDQSFHEGRARNQIDSRVRDWSFQKLGSPILTPTFPRPAVDWRVYTHSLDRDTILTNLPGLKRIDNQLIAMIDDARERLAGRGITTDARVFMWGYSASGTFTNRFVILHPDRVKAAIYGGNTFPVVPVAEYEGRRLRYPIGIADLPEIAGQTFDVARFRLVPMQIFRGEDDTNDEVAYSDGYDAEDASLINELFGNGPPLFRYPGIEGLYRSVQANARFVIDPGVGHSYGTMWPEVLRFFEASRGDPPAPLPDKPLAFKMHFPHVACTEGWGTEIGIVNTMNGIPLTGQIFGYSSRGGSALFMTRFSVPSRGRKQINACTELPNAAEVSYLTLVTDAGFQGGYTKFYRDGNRVSIAAGKGARAGTLAKMEKHGWTGIGFLNTEESDASVRVAAYDDEGMELAVVTVPVGAGKRVAATPEELFQSDLQRATHFRYKSNRTVIAFALNGSADGAMLDGLSSVMDYLR